MLCHWIQSDSDPISKSCVHVSLHKDVGVQCSITIRLPLSICDLPPLFQQFAGSHLELVVILFA